MVVRGVISIAVALLLFRHGEVHWFVTMLAWVNLVYGFVVILLGLIDKKK